MELKKKIAVVTGSSSGIGRAVALRLASEGCSVMVNSSNSSEKGSAVAEEINNLGGEAKYFNADVSTESGATALIEYTQDQFGGIDILINNAGLTLPEESDEATSSHWQKMIDVNLMSCVFCSNAALPLMKARGSGRIVNTASIRGLFDHGRSGVSAYCSAKAAVISYTKNLASKVAPEVLVNAVAPGFVSTAYMERVSSEQKAEWISTIPIGRFIDPDEIAKYYTSLASTDILCGTILTVDGGVTLGS